MTFYWPRLQARILLIRQCHFLGVCISDDGIYSLNFCCCYSLLLHGFLPVCSGAKSSFLPSIWPDFLPEQRITGTLGEATTNIPLDPFYASKYVMIAISLGTQTNKSLDSGLIIGPCGKSLPTRFLLWWRFHPASVPWFDRHQCNTLHRWLGPAYPSGKFS